MAQPVASDRSKIRVRGPCRHSCRHGAFCFREQDSSRSEMAVEVGFLAFTRHGAPRPRMIGLLDMATVATKISAAVTVDRLMAHGSAGPTRHVRRHRRLAVTSKANYQEIKSQRHGSPSS